MKLYSKLFLMLALIAAIGLSDCSKQESHQGHEQAEKKEVYTCPMHPNVLSDKPGACPICGMDLVLKISEDESASEETTGTIALSQNKQVLADVATAEIHTENISKEITAYSYLDFAEPNRKVITARFNGRIEKLYVDRTGAYIKMKQPLFQIYSPDLVQAQNDYLIGLSGISGIDGKKNSDQLLTATRKKMELLGLTDEQIQELETTREVKLTLTYYSPINGTVIEKNIQEGMYINEGSVLYDVADLSMLWNIAEVFESDLGVIKMGSKVKLRLQSFPGESFEGKVTYIYPVVNPQTRTIKVRSEFSNIDNKLKPQMFGETTFENNFGAGLTVPANAVLFTGTRNIVWIQTGDGTYEPREVEVGIKMNEKYQILSGLHEGEKVVSSGGFLIDSESQLKGGTGMGHQHSATESENSGHSKTVEKNDEQHKH
jgi:Cu(I)/Ag(I) efflux system membrane fusion protein